MKWLIRLAVLAGALFLVWHFAAPAYAEWRLRDEMVKAGVRDKVAGCIAGRIAHQLTTRQLLKLGALAEEKRSLREWRHAAEKMDDPDIAIVATSSAVLCSTGLAR